MTNPLMIEYDDPRDRAVAVLRNIVALNRLQATLKEIDNSIELAEEVLELIDAEGS